ncbi:hypothetical protein B481_2718 [Planococcus halocryophilus Or1]|nr:hypothetical protein B481_2718 [Planococcus halocryophilus Or1]
MLLAFIFLLASCSTGYPAKELVGVVFYLLKLRVDNGWFN